MSGTCVALLEYIWSIWSPYCFRSHVTAVCLCLSVMPAHCYISKCCIYMLSWWWEDQHDRTSFHSFAQLLLHEIIFRGSVPPSPGPDSCSVAFPLPLQRHHPPLLKAADAGKQSHPIPSQSGRKQISFLHFFFCGWPRNEQLRLLLCRRRHNNMLMFMILIWVITRKGLHIPHTVQASVWIAWFYLLSL